MSNSSLSKYDPLLHFNHGKPWNMRDINYLIKFHNDSRTDLSLALGRTYKTIADRIYNLKKKGMINVSK